MPSRLVALVAVALLCPSASAQLAVAPGPFAALGSAAPDHALSAFDTAPAVRAGWRFGRGLAVEGGLALRSRTRPVGPTLSRPARPGDVLGERTFSTRALTIGASATRPVGGLEVRARAGVGAAQLAGETRSRGTFVAGEGDAPVRFVPGRSTSRAASVLGRAAASATLAVPIARGEARIAPGLAVALAYDRALGGPAPDATGWGVFLTVPSTVPLGSTALTLDAAVGVQRDAGLRVPGADPWALSLDLAVRVDL